MMRTRLFKFLAVGTVGVALLVGGLVIASNIGYKFIYRLTHTGVLNANDFQVSIPYNTPLANAKALLDSALGATQVARLEPTSNTFESWAFQDPPVLNFPILTGEGYIVRIPQFVTSSITFVGSHNPGTTVNFNVANTDFLSSVPYHTVWTVAKEMFDDIIHAKQVARLKPSSNTFTIWAIGANPDQNFDIVIGEAYRVRVNDTPSPQVPPHF